jgi:hypothetical protein
MLHPNPVQIFKLWQSYLDNINPLVKVFHAPTVQQLISDASGDLDNVDRNVEALLFAIYCIVTESLSDGECKQILATSVCAAYTDLGLQYFRHRDTWTVKVRGYATFQSWRAICAHKCKPSEVIGSHGAASIYALHCQTSCLPKRDLVLANAAQLSYQNFDARIIWIWSGIAQRIGQRIGLHRDPVKLGLLPFDVEMRRRLWWQIMMLEGFSQKLAGTGTGGIILMGDVSNATQS